MVLAQATDSARATVRSLLVERTARTSRASVIYTPSTALVIPSWAAEVPEVPRLLAARWAGTRHAIMHAQLRDKLASVPIRHPVIANPFLHALIRDYLVLASAYSEQTFLGAGGLHVPVWELDAATGQVRREILLVPDPAAQGSQPVGDSAGGLREKSLEKLALPVTVLLNSQSGYVGRAPTAMLEWTTTMPVHGSTSIWSGRHVLDLTWSGQATSRHKSEMIATLEALERQAGAIQADTDFVTARAQDLDSRYVAPDDLGRYPDEAYTTQSGLHRFLVDAPVEWVAVESLATSESLYVPREFVYYGQQLSTPRVGLSTSNGCATGSSVAEATLFGLLELVERDAFISGWYSGLDPIGLDPDSIENVGELLRRARLLGYDISIVSTMTDLAIPSVAAVAYSKGALAFGAAAHPNPHVAARAALLEAVAYIPEREQRGKTFEARARNLLSSPTSVASIEDHPLLYSTPEAQRWVGRYLHPAVQIPIADAFAAATVFGPDTETPEILKSYASTLLCKGIDVLRRRVTPPISSALGLETVTVLAPGLVPIDFGWHRQRARTMERVFTSTGMQPSLVEVPHPFS